MRLLGRIFGRWLIWVLPVNLLDGCLNRDPYLKIDESFTLYAICGSCPKSLSYESPNWRQEIRSAFDQQSEDQPMKSYEEWLENSKWTLDSVKEFKMSDGILTGGSEKGWFLADRRTGKRRFFPANSERLQAIRDSYGLDPLKDLHPPSQWMWQRSRLFWPWMELYYLGCLLFIIRREIKIGRLPPMAHGPAS